MTASARWRERWELLNIVDQGLCPVRRRRGVVLWTASARWRGDLHIRRYLVPPDLLVDDELKVDILGVGEPLAGRRATVPAHIWRRLVFTSRVRGSDRRLPMDLVLHLGDGAKVAREKCLAERGCTRRASSRTPSARRPVPDRDY